MSILVRRLDRADTQMCQASSSQSCDVLGDRPTSTSHCEHLALSVFQSGCLWESHLLFSVPGLAEARLTEEQIHSGCNPWLSLPSCSLCAAYKRSPMTVHLVLSQALFMCFKPPIEHGTLSNQLSKLDPGVQ